MNSKIQIQGVPRLDETKITEEQWKRLAECAYRILVKLKSTKAGRKMLRDEIELMRKEKAERNVAKC